jgi:hypothetical protein
MSWDLQWFSNKQSFYDHADMENKTTAEWVSKWIMTADMTKPFIGPVFGGFDSKIKSMTEGFRAEFDFQER